MSRADVVMADIERLAVACALRDWAAREPEQPIFGDSSETGLFWEPSVRTDYVVGEVRADWWLRRASDLLAAVRDQDAALARLARRDDVGRRARRHAAHAIRRLGVATGRILVCGFGPGWRARPMVFVDLTNAAPASKAKRSA